jgi:hypothetical protein
VALSLNEKAKVTEAKEKDKLSVREIMMRFKQIKWGLNKKKVVR